MLDTFVSIPVTAAFVPFVSSYKTFWLGLGAIALDLLLALLATSLLRNRLGHRSWRRVHWLAYACWPIGLVHGLGIGTDRASDLGVRADRDMRGGRGRSGNMAAGHRGPAGYPVTDSRSSRTGRRTCACPPARRHLLLRRGRPA